MPKELTKIKSEKGEPSSVNVLHKNEELLIHAPHQIQRQPLSKKLINLKNLLVNFKELLIKNQTQPVSQKIGILDLHLQICNLKKEIFSTNFQCLLISFMNETLMDFLNRKFLINLATFLWLLTVT
jgi:hypothetical protein